MASISLTESASEELLSSILAGEPWPDWLLRRALVEDEGRTLLSVVVERLADLFEPRLCDEYARMFTRVIELLRPDIKATDLLSRYERVRQVKPVRGGRVQNVFVLSRVTLGADVAVTSVILDALKKRYPDATIYLAGSRRNWELFAADSRIRHLPFPYPKTGSLVERLSRWGNFEAPNGIVVDPDSRLTQLGILPVSAEESYYFFESRSYGGDSDDSLPVLTRRWVKQVFGVEGNPFIAPKPVEMDNEVAVSFGVGGNTRKRIEGGFEEGVLDLLLQRDLKVVLDAGAGDEETDRARRLHSRLPAVQLYDGSYAPFASMISQAKLYIGYDSAGQHMAAACGTPLVSVFAGYPSERTFQRWRPVGPGPCAIVKAGSSRTAANDALESVQTHLDTLLAPQ